MNRKQAQAAGARFYTSERPCANGHTSDRYTSTGNCAACQKERQDASREALREAQRAIGQGVRLFAYRLHPDDVAAALAFCQGLDLQRGKLPAAAPVVLLPPKAQAFADPRPPVPPGFLAAAREVYDHSPEILAQHDAHRRPLR